MQLPKNAWSEAEAAKFAGLKPNTLRKYRQLGVGPVYIRISGRCVCYLRSDVEEWLLARRVMPGSSAVREVSSERGPAGPP